MPASGDFLEKPLEKQKHTGQGDDRPLPGVFVFSFSPPAPHSGNHISF